MLALLVIALVALPLAYAAAAALRGYAGRLIWRSTVMPSLAVSE